MTVKIALDTSFVLGLLDQRDIWHGRSITLKAELAAHGFLPVVFDCVLAEAISTLARRTHEGRRSADLAELLMILKRDFPTNSIVWTYPDLPGLYEHVVDLVEQSGGELNFNDALIALSCQNRRIEQLASFDNDFDQVKWLRRVSEPSKIANGSEGDSK